MKTWDGKSPPKKAQPKAGCCGEPAERLDTLKKVSAATAAAHTMMAGLYRSLAEDYKSDPIEHAQIVAAAERQERLAEESKIVTVPDNLDKEG